ncbi:MAG: glycerophosphodiester phosphodiesterase family protein [Natronosporangium sp.]
MVVTTPVAVSAHKGGGERYPAASWEAYRSAAATGAEYVEFDVRRLADGALVCYHDPRAGGSGPLLRTLSYRQLCDTVGFEVPTMAGVAAEIAAGGAAGHVDLKETGYEAEVVELAREVFGEGGFVATSLEDESIARITRAFPRVRTALSLGRGRAEVPPGRLLDTRLRELFPLRRVRATGAGWVAVDKTLARYGVLAQCARHGIGAMVWTVDETALIDRFLADPRVRVLVTNRPGYALRRRDRLAG